MTMTDEEILREFREAKDKKEQVKILADENLTSVWEMSQKLHELKAPGLDLRWYQTLNPNRKPVEKTEKEPKDPRLAALQRIVEKQQEEIQRLTDGGSSFPTEKIKLISWFVQDMIGGAAWFVGRLVELLYAWRDTGDGTQLKAFLKEYAEKEATEV